MFSIKRLFCLLFIAFFIGTPISAATAADIPLLTWERGRIQEVVLGGGAISNNWNVQLEGMGITPISFTKSNVNGDGYVVFSANLPKDLPLGGYSIVTSGTGSPSTVVAGVNLVEQVAYNVTNVPIDLTWIIALFVFLTTVLSTLRARRYAHLSFDSTQPIDENLPVSTKIIDQISNLPYLWRLRTISRQRTSLIRFLILREGELIHRASKQLYAALPIIGFFAGVVATNETQKAGGIGKAGLAVFIGVALIGIIDAYSGITATIGFWVTQLIIGNVSSLRDILIMLSTALAWIGPVLFASLLRDALAIDLTSSRQLEKAFGIRALGIIFSGLIGGGVFYLGQILLNSVLINFTQTRGISLLALIILTIAIILREIISDVILHPSNSKRHSYDQHPENIQLARVSSPQTAIILLASIYSFVYIWTQSSQKSLIVALLFSIPYFLLFVRINEIRVPALVNIRRFLIGEALLVSSLTFLIFSQINAEPLLVSQRTNLLLVLAAIPGGLHAIYSAFFDSAESQGILRP
jgi:hypothetical protein